ncbi:MAG: hypothetical protein EA357_08420 [Micavibrio sp.]|nr:MAG: hypothetical protein EA357_08420 [Micavibrio sp.]
MSAAAPPAAVFAAGRVGGIASVLSLSVWTDRIQDSGGKSDTADGKDFVLQRKILIVIVCKSQ